MHSQINLLLSSAQPPDCGRSGYNIRGMPLGRHMFTTAVTINSGDALSVKTDLRMAPRITEYNLLFQFAETHHGSFRTLTYRIIKKSRSNYLSKDLYMLKTNTNLQQIRWYLKPVENKFILCCNFDVKKLPINLPKFYRECFECFAPCSSTTCKSLHELLQEEISNTVIWNNKLNSFASVNG